MARRHPNKKRLTIQDIQGIYKGIVEDLDSGSHNSKLIDIIMDKYGCSVEDFYHIKNVIVNARNNRFPELLNLMLSGKIIPFNGYRMNGSLVKFCKSIGVEKNKIDDYLTDSRVVSWKRNALNKYNGCIAEIDKEVFNGVILDDEFDAALKKINDEYKESVMSCIPKKGCRCKCGHRWIEDKYFIPKFCPNCGNKYKPED